jgi:tetratricopeptide (TPR) repeat protein
MRKLMYSRNFFKQMLTVPIWSVLIILTIPGSSRGQDNHITDSLKKNVLQSTTDTEKVYALLKLADNYPFENDSSKKYGAQALRIAVLNRDRKLIVWVYLRNGSRYLRNPNDLSAAYQLGAENYEQAEKLAKENGLDEELAYSYLGLSKASRFMGEFDKAYDYCNMAFAIATPSQNDSLKFITFLAIGDYYRARKELLLAFRNYLNALAIGELSKREDLLLTAYINLCFYYADLGDHDKAIDYLIKTVVIDRKKQNLYNLAGDYYNLGKQFSAKGDLDMGQEMFEHCAALYDSLQLPEFKGDPYLSIARMYYENNQVVRELDYMKEHPQIAEIVKMANLGYFFDEMYGNAYTHLGKFDSAYYFYKRAEPVVEQKTSLEGRYEFYTMFGTFFKTKGDNQQAIRYFLKARDIGIKTNDLNDLAVSANELDTLYGRVGDYKAAWQYDQVYNHYKDSLQSLSKESDLLKLEVDNDNKRRDRLAREQEENTLRRHNLQYMGFTVGIVCLFILLLMTGFFVASPWVVRALSFFSFIFLFEFIIMLADKRITAWTHDEPWMVLAFKIGLAAILLPMHHKLEHRLLHYLSSRKRFASSRPTLFSRLFKRKTGPAPVAPDAE